MRSQGISELRAWTLAAAAALAVLTSCGADDETGPGAGDAACGSSLLRLDPCLAGVVIDLHDCVDGAGSCSWSEVAGPPHTRHLLEWSNGAKDEIEFEGAEFVAQRYTSASGKICMTAKVSEAGCNGLRWMVDGQTIALCAEDNLDGGVSETPVYRCADGTRHGLPRADGIAIARACRGTPANTSTGASAQCLDDKGNPYTGVPTAPAMAP